MAKSRRRSHQARARGDHHPDLASRRLPRDLPSIQTRSFDAMSLLRHVESTFHRLAEPIVSPLHKVRAFHQINLRPSQVKVQRPGLSPVIPRSLPFRSPQRVHRCVRRKQRRETLFALRRAGYSGSAPKRHYRRNAFSNYSCR